MSGLQVCEESAHCMGDYEPAGKSPLSDGTAFAENNDLPPYENALLSLLSQRIWHSAGSPALYPETFPAAWCRGGTGVRFLYGRVRMVKKALSALQAVLGVSRSFKSWNLKFLHMEQMVSIHETLGSIA